MVEVDGRVRLADAPAFNSGDLNPGAGAAVQLPPNTRGILCTRHSIVPFPDDHLLLRRGLSLYIQAEEDRPGRVILLLEMRDGAPRYSMYEGEASDREKDEIDAVLAAFPPI